MKYLSLWLLFTLMACKSSQTELPILQNCPGNGDCEVEIFKETKLLVTEISSEVKDVSFEEDVNFQVIFIRYKDSDKINYSEEIYLQIPSRFKEIHSKNHSLQNQKVVIGKFCDCEEEGFERINHGELLIVNRKDRISLQLDIGSKKSYILETVNLDI